MHGLDLSHSPTIFELGNACSESEVSAIQLSHDHGLLKFQKDGFNCNLDRKYNHVLKLAEDLLKFNF